MSGGPRPGAGRKPVHIDLVELEKLCQLQCTNGEIAAWFGISPRTLEKRCKDPQFAEVMVRGRAKGCISLRKVQMKLAEAGNSAMAIWLGKQLLGQRDVTPIELSGPRGQAVQLTLEAIDELVAHAKKNPKSRADR